MMDTANDLWAAILRGKGFVGTVNDMWSQWLISLGYKGTLNDMWYQWLLAGGSSGGGFDIADTKAVYVNKSEGPIFGGTYIVPLDATSMSVICMGGGGGGATGRNGPTGNARTGGGGGGSGGITIVSYDIATDLAPNFSPGSPISVVGGRGGDQASVFPLVVSTDGANGSDGGDSYVLDVNSGVKVGVAGGGKGGEGGGSGFAGGSGGLGGIGLTINGNQGGSGGTDNNPAPDGGSTTNASGGGAGGGGISGGNVPGDGGNGGVPSTLTFPLVPPVGASEISARVAGNYFDFSNTGTGDWSSYASGGGGSAIINNASSGIYSQAGGSGPGAGGSGVGAVDDAIIVFASNQAYAGNGGSGICIVIFL